MNQTGIFLLIVMSLFGCKGNYPGSGEVINHDRRGTAVALTDHCQSLSVIEPEEVRKHELPFILQGFRDECSVLILAPHHQFKRTDRNYYFCSLIWSATDTAANGKMESDVNTNAGQDISSQIFNEGDIDASQTTTGDLHKILVFYLDDSDQRQFGWTREALWPLLTDQIVTLDDLQWRYDLQSTSPSLCSQEARWGIADNNIFVDDVEKCHSDGFLKKDDFVFSRSGILLNLTSEVISAEPNCH